MAVNWEWWTDGDKVVSCESCMKERDIDLADLPVEVRNDATLTGDPCSSCGYEPSE